jgi:hypothetical protein
MSAWTCRSVNGKAAHKIVPPRLRIPYWKGRGADSEEKHEPASGVDTELVDSLKALDPEGPIREGPIREADIPRWATAALISFDQGFEPRPRTMGIHQKRVRLPAGGFGYS